METRTRLTKAEFKSLKACNDKLLKIIRKYECDQAEWSLHFQAQMKAVVDAQSLLINVYLKEAWYNK